MPVKITDFIEQACGQFDSISTSRQEVLAAVARGIQERIEAGQGVPLTFICTHNSRRSHLAQVWAHVAASRYGIPSVKTYSGGTEVTECNPRTIRALARTGIVVNEPEGINPKYVLDFGDQAEKLECFSKLYAKPPNPTDSYFAMMCCGHVDETCPVVEGAAERFSIHYLDPKVSDDSEDESATYDERCLQIATEMFKLMSLVTDSNSH